MNRNAKGLGAWLPVGFGRKPAYIAVLLAGVVSSPVHAQWAVFDSANYVQNVMTAARELQQITNQIQSLQNEAVMLQNMAKNLQNLNFSSLGQMTSALNQINTLMNQANGIAFTVNATNSAFQQSYPGSYPASETTAQAVAEAQTRWQNSMSAYQQTMQVQAQVDQNVQADAATLSDLVNASQGAAGALEAQQATNQLLALLIKQEMQIETLMAAQYRASAVGQANQSQGQLTSQAAATRFLGSGTAYTQ